MIDVIILDIVEPAHFILRECPSSRASKEFLRMENSINKFYSRVSNVTPYIPLDDDVVVVQPEKDGKYYRAKIEQILSSPRGYDYRVFLLDYGKTYNISSNKIFKIREEFLQFPHQAVHFHLKGIKPLSRVIDPFDLSLPYAPVEVWDYSAIHFVKSLWKKVIASQIKIEISKEGHLYGQLHVNIGYGFICLNEILTGDKYAYYDSDFFEGSDTFIKVENPTEFLPSSYYPSNIKEKISDKPKMENSKSNETTDSEMSQLSIESGPAQIDPARIQRRRAGKYSSSSSSTEYPASENSNPSLNSYQNKSLRDRHAINASSLSSISSGKTFGRGCIQGLPNEKRLLPVSPESQLSENHNQMQVAPQNFEKHPSLSPSPSIGRGCIQGLHHEKSSSSAVSSNPVSSCKSIGRGHIYELYVEKSDSSPVFDKAEIASGPKGNASPSISPQNSEKDPSVSPCKSIGRGHIYELYIEKSSPVFSNAQTDNVPKGSASISISPQNSENDPAASPCKSLGRGHIYELYGEKSNSSPDFTKVQIESVLKNNASPSSPSPSKHHSMIQSSSIGRGCVKRLYTEKLNSSPVSLNDTHTDNILKKNASASASPPICEKPRPSMGRGQILKLLPSSSSGEILSTASESNEMHSEDSSDLCDEMRKSLQMSNNRSSSELICDHSLKSDDDTGLEKYLDELLMVEYDKSRLRQSEKELPSPEKNEPVKPSVTKPVDYMKKLLHSKDMIDEENYIDPFVKTKLDFSNQTLFEAQRLPALCIGEELASAAVLITEETPFIKEVEKQLDYLKFWGPSCIQSIVWPAMFRSRSFIAVAPPSSGKTVAYLLPILSFIGERSNCAFSPQCSGPLTFILCSSWRKVMTVYQQAKTLLGHNIKVNIKTAIGDGTSLKERATLIKSCDILITTPSILADCLNKKIANFERCRHFILDDGNNIIKLNLPKISEIMKRLLHHKKKHSTTHQTQLIVCTERWSRGISSFMKAFMKEPLMFFTSFLESAVYANLKLNIHMCNETEEGHVLLDILRSLPGAKIVIMCMSAMVASQVHEFLRAGAFFPIVAHENMPHYSLEGVKKQWSISYSSKNPLILVLSDAAMLNLNLNDADCLIHYDLPEDSRLQFSNRFSCFAKKFSASKNLVAFDYACHVIVTPKYQMQAPSLLSLLNRLGCIIPPELKVMSSHQKMCEINPNTPLCHYFKSFGSCLLYNCKKRHIFLADIDKASVIPSQGDVKIRVSHIFDAGHYYAQIMYYLDPLTRKTVSRTAEYAKISMAMQAHYNLSCNQIKLDRIDADTLCCVKIKNGVFHRAKVLSVESDGEEIKAKLFFIDEGWVRKTTEDFIYVLAEQFISNPPIAAEIILCNVKPADCSFDWNPETTEFVFQLIAGQEIYGKIMLCLGNILFLNPVSLRETNLTYLNEPLNTLNLGETLKQNGHAIDNKQHIHLLHEACKGKIELPMMIKKLDKENLRKEVKKEVTSCEVSNTDGEKTDASLSQSEVLKKEPKKDVTSWEVFNMDVEWVEVYVSFVESPDQFFVQKAEFADRLDEMNEEISAEFDRGQLTLCSILYKGMICLAPLPEDNMYYRGRVVDVFEEDEDMANIFFVDFGDRCIAKKDQLFVLPKEFTSLPFQAIECQLLGSSPTHGGWTKEAIEFLNKRCRDEENKMSLMELKIWKQNISSHDSGCNQYAVELFSGDANVGEQLIIEGFAVKVDVLWNSNAKTMEPPELPPFVYDDSNMSDDSQREDKEAAALMSGVLAMMKANIDDYIPEAKQEKQIMETKPPQVNETIIPKTSDNSDLKPNVLWWDTASEVNVRIEFAEKSKISMDVSSSGFKFRSTFEGNTYSLDETLFGKVDPEKSNLKTSENSVLFVFSKKENKKWPRLIQSKNKMFYIKYDMNHLDSDSESENKPLEDRPPINRKEVLNDDLNVDYQDFSSSDDEPPLPNLSNPHDRFYRIPTTL